VVEVVQKARSERPGSNLGRCDACMESFITGARLEVGAEGEVCLHGASDAPTWIHWTLWGPTDSVQHRGASHPLAENSDPTHDLTVQPFQMLTSKH
jgi:hypothetical protein